MFIPPAGATRLYLGFLDGSDFHGDPGYNADNAGGIEVEVTGGRV